MSTVSIPNEYRVYTKRFGDSAALVSRRSWAKFRKVITLNQAKTLRHSFSPGRYVYIGGEIKGYRIDWSLIPAYINRVNLWQHNIRAKRNGATNALD